MAKFKGFGILVLCLLFGSSSSWGGNDKVKLKDIEVLTLYSGRMTSGRRSSPVPQLKCMGGTANCGFVPQVVQCYNRGFDGYDTQWECKSDMDNAYRFGKISVTCEGYDYPDDPYVLKGSCGLEYTIDLTKEGMANSQYYQQNHDYYGNGREYEQTFRKSKPHGGFINNVAVGCVIIIIVYAIYMTCIRRDVRRQRSSTDDDYHGRGPGSAPPPPGFRTDYYPSSPNNDAGSDSCSGNRQQQSSSTGGIGANAGGFWTGAATGGILGYLFGQRNNNTHYGGATYRPRPSTSWGSGSWGSGSSGGWSGSSSSSSSSGTRTASGFGGTSRR